MLLAAYEQLYESYVLSFELPEILKGMNANNNTNQPLIPNSFFHCIISNCTHLLK